MTWLDELEARRRAATDPGAVDEAGRLLHRPQDRREFLAAAAALRRSGLTAHDVARVLELTAGAVRDLWYELDHEGRERFTSSAAPTLRIGGRL